MSTTSVRTNTPTANPNPDALHLHAADVRHMVRDLRRNVNHTWHELREARGPEDGDAHLTAVEAHAALDGLDNLADALEQMAQG